MFLGLHANRDSINDSKLKSQYIDNVKEVKDLTNSLLGNLPVKPPAPPECSKTKRKRDTILGRTRFRALLSDSKFSERSLISGLTDLAGDIGKLLSCASRIVNNLLDKINLPIPPFDEIEALTDDLQDLGTYLEEAEKNKPSGSASNSEVGLSHA